MERAASDETFRQALLRDPKGTVRREFGVEIPANLNMHILQNDATHLHIVLPREAGELAHMSTDEVAQHLGASAQGQDAHVRLVARAITDHVFKQELLRNPKTAVGQALQVALPENMSVQVHEADDDNLYVLLPPRRELSDAELSDEQLEAVAGGEVAIVALVVGIVALGTSVALPIIQKKTSW
jgi:hypothetical protein